jgi:hypothetical protein
MNENIKNLVDAMLAKDATKTESAFQAAMAEKISAKLDDMRTSMAQSMFKTPEAVVEEEVTITEEQYEALSEEEKAEYEVIEEGAGKTIKKVAKVTADLLKGTAKVAGATVGAVAKTAGAIRQTPAAVKDAYNKGRVGAQKAIAG